MMPTPSTDRLDRASWAAEFVPERFRTTMLDQLVTDDPQDIEIITAVASYTRGVLAGEFRPLWIYGPPGVGKTLLAACAWHQIAAQIGDREAWRAAHEAGTAANAAWITGAELPQICTTRDRTDGRTKEQAMTHLATAFFVVLDDADKCAGGNGWGAALLELLDQRLVQAGLPTLLTTNLTPAKFALKYGEAGEPIVSRVVRYGGIFVRLDRELKVLPQQQQI